MARTKATRVLAWIVIFAAISAIGWQGSLIVCERLEVNARSRTVTLNGSRQVVFDPNRRGITDGEKIWINEGGSITGPLIYDDDSTATPDGGVTFSFTNGVPGRLIRQVNGSVDVAWYGAVADWNGTSGTNVANEIGNAITAAQSLGRKIYLGGDYYTNTSHDFTTTKGLDGPGSINGTTNARAAITNTDTYEVDDVAGPFSALPAGTFQDGQQIILTGIHGQGRIATYSETSSTDIPHIYYTGPGGVGRVIAEDFEQSVVHNRRHIERTFRVQSDLANHPINNTQLARLTIPLSSTTTQRQLCDFDVEINQTQGESTSSPRRQIVYIGNVGLSIGNGVYNLRTRTKEYRPAQTPGSTNWNFNVGYQIVGTNLQIDIQPVQTSTATFLPVFLVKIHGKFSSITTAGNLANPDLNFVRVSGQPAATNRLMFPQIDPLETLLYADDATAQADANLPSNAMYRINNGTAWELRVKQ